MNWKQKLSSRKFWVLLAALAGSVLVAVGADAGTTERVIGIIGALGSCAVYICAEAHADANRIIVTESDEAKLKQAGD